MPLAFTQEDFLVIFTSKVLALESILADTDRLKILDGPDVDQEHLYLIQVSRRRVNIYLSPYEIKGIQCICVFLDRDSSETRS